jgi:hypothetical protein
MGVNEAEWAAKHRANVGPSQLSQQPQSCNAQLFASEEYEWAEMVDYQTDMEWQTVLEKRASWACRHSGKLTGRQGRLVQGLLRYKGNDAMMDMGLVVDMTR